MRGELWQECNRFGCDNEPVCSECELCERHCTCRPEPTEEEKAAKKAAQAARIAATAAARAELIDQASDPNADPLSFPLEKRNQSGATFAKPWLPLATERERASVLDGIIELHEQYRKARPEWTSEYPATTRMEAIRLLAAGKVLHFGTEWYEEVRMPEQVSADAPEGDEEDED